MEVGEGRIRAQPVAEYMCDIAPDLTSARPYLIVFSQGGEGASEEDCRSRHPAQWDHAATVSRVAGRGRGVALANKPVRVVGAPLYRDRRVGAAAPARQDTASSVPARAGWASTSPTRVADPLRASP